MLKGAELSQITDISYFTCEKIPAESRKVLAKEPLLMLLRGLSQDLKSLGSEVT